MTYSKENLIKYRIERAYETFNEAKLLAKNGFWNSAANRLYYSCYYIIIALFIKPKIISHTHSGVKSQLHKYFIREGIIPENYGKLYSDLFNKRQEGDYEDFIKFRQEDIEPLLAETEKFLNFIKSLIEK